MRVIEPYVILEDEINGQEIIKKIEKIGRVCYKSEDNITEDSAERFIRNIIDRGHESVLEHVSISVRVVCDRGVSHEIVRHRVASYSQESTRYCNYSNEKFGDELTFIKPCYWDEDSDSMKLWEVTMGIIENTYQCLIKQQKATPEQARSILPNSLKTEIVITMNLREWRHFFKLRCAKAAHPQMKQVAYLILEQFQKEIPIIFDEI